MKSKIITRYVYIYRTYEKHHLLIVLTMLKSLDIAIKDVYTMGEMYYIEFKDSESKIDRLLDILDKYPELYDVFPPGLSRYVIEARE